MSWGVRSAASAPFDPDMFSSCLYLGLFRRREVSKLSGLAAEKASLSTYDMSPGGGVTSIWNISVTFCLERSGAVCSEVHEVPGRRLRRPHSEVGNAAKRGSGIKALGRYV